MAERTIPMPEGATCPRCRHPSGAHASGTCLAETRPPDVNAYGGGTWHLCGCGYWQGPRPWLGEGPAWDLNAKEH